MIGRHLPISFEQPAYLLLLLALPLLFLLARRSRSGLERGRAVTAVILRALLFVSIVFALAEARWVSRSSRAATIFVLDQSHSIPLELQKAALDWTKEQLGKLPKEDLAGVIVFGAEAMIEIPPDPRPALNSTSCIITRSASNLGAALRLALAVFPKGYQRRVVLISDGNENRGYALAEAELARAHGVVVEVLPLRYDYPNEVWIEGVHVPPDVTPREPFDVTVVVNSQREGPATLTLHRNRALLSMEKVQLTKGKNVFTVRQKVEDAGSLVYEAVIAMDGDTISQNNIGHALALARGASRVAIVPGEPVDAEKLLAGLREEGVFAEVIPPADIASGFPDAPNYDAIILANVPASDLSKASMRSMEAAVHDAGVGFIMIGGENSYGPGGYRGTPIEELLPVTMEQPQRRVIPNGALCLILHTCEFPDGNYWAKQISNAALNVLGPKDYMGVLFYGGGGETWLFPMSPVTDKAKLSALIMGADPGDMPGFDKTMQMAHKGLKETDAAGKHLVIISDSDPSGPSAALVGAIVQDRITISTVAIYPHSETDIDKMAKVAQAGRGRFYHVKDPATLPQIFIKEAATIQRSMIIEGRIPPVVQGQAEALKGIKADELPALHGYTLTNPKALSRTSLGAPVAKKEGESGPAVTDALLSEWTYGLGRTIAFTSDAKPRWAQEWVGWEKYRKFWSQAVRSVLRTVPRAPFAIQSQIEGGKGRVIIDAIDDKGKFIHTLQFGGKATSPTGKDTSLHFRQVGPGRYEAEFEADETGVYSIAGAYEGLHGERGFFTQGVTLSYAEEYRELKANLPLLNQLHERTGGRRLALDTPVYVPFPYASGVAVPIWPLLVAFLLVAFPIDIFIRRVALDWGRLRQRLVAWVRRKPLPQAVPAPATLQALITRKQEVRAAEISAASSPVDLDAMAKSRAPASEAPGSASPPPPSTPAPAKTDAGEDDYMKRLLDAKKKAKGK